MGLGGPVDPEDVEEFVRLAQSAGAVPVATISGRRNRPDPRYFVGSGKADEIKALVASTGAHGVIFDQTLSPAQQRNLEHHLGVPVADLVGLLGRHAGFRPDDPRSGQGGKRTERQP